MIRWMRDYNANPSRDRELRFYCMDGTGNWSHATHAYRAVHDFARRVDENLAVDLARDLEAGVKSATFETRAQIERDTWHALIANASLVVSQIEQSRLDYVAASSQDDYEWALRSAQTLHDVLVNLAQVELDFSLGFRHFCEYDSRQYQERLARHLPCNSSQVCSAISLGVRVPFQSSLRPA